MFPLALVFTACLAADPAACREEILPVDGFATAMQCTMGAQGVLAQWQAYHPTLSVRGYRCMPSNRISQGI